MTESANEQQLAMIKQALLACDNDEDRANLESLERDLTELISLENQSKQEEEAELSSELKVGSITESM